MSVAFEREREREMSGLINGNLLGTQAQSSPGTQLPSS